MAFTDRLLAAPAGGGFSMSDYWVWCGSVAQGDDGLFHMFASRWPRQYPFFDGYRLYSEVAHATSPTPEGPYTFRDVALPARGAEHWDGRMTHNPTIHRWRDMWLLFYIGATWSGPDVAPAEIVGSPKPAESYANIRIGLATSRTLDGPWERREAPILLPRPGKWDSTVVTNPAPCVRDDGRILMLYRANTPAGLRIGAAMADGPDAPFRRLSDEPVLHLPGGGFVEDPYVWWNGTRYEALAKDMTGSLTGEFHAGVHLAAPDGLAWTVSDPPKAYSRRVVWQDGGVTMQGSLERPQLLMSCGQPTHLFAATADGPGGFRHATRTWNMVIPLRPEV